MATKTEIKRVHHKGQWYTCVIKRLILANGTVGNSWIDSARDSSGAPVGDQATLNRLADLI